MNEELYYRATLDSMTSNQIARMVNISEGIPISFCDQWTWKALSDKGLVISFAEWCDLLVMSHQTAMSFSELERDNQLTDYGKAFLAWYRQPHDTPQQLELF